MSTVFESGENDTGISQSMLNQYQIVFHYSLAKLIPAPPITDYQSAHYTLIVRTFISEVMDSRES